MRGRAALTTLAAAAALALPTGALAATSQQIFSDASDGSLDKSYSKWELEKAMRDSTVQGYGNPIVQITLVNVINNTNNNSNSNSNSNSQTQTQTSSNTNNSNSNATGGTANANSTSNANAAANASCGPGSASSSNSGASSNSNSGGGGSCTHTKSGGKQVFTPPYRRSSDNGNGNGGGKRHNGTLPFTGSHLAAFLSLGIALLSGGGILRLMARRRTLAS